MTDYNKIITTVNSITPDYDFIPDLNNTIVIDTSENRIGINTITPDENIHVSGGTIKTQDLIVLGDFSNNNFSSNILPRDDLSYNIGSITHRWNDLFIGSGTMYMDKTPILRMADYTRHGNPAVDISALIIDNSGQHLDISDIRHVNVEGDVSFASNFDLRDHMIVHGDVSFNKDFDVSGVLNLTQLLTSDGLVTTGTKIYTIYETNSAGSTTTRLIIDPSGDGIAGNAAAQGEVVIYGNLDVKGETTYLKSTNVDISDNIIRMNANHNSVTDGGIAVTNSSNADKLFTYNNPGNYWTTTDTNINLGPNGGVVSSGFMNIDNVNIDANTIDVDSGDLILKSDTGQVVVENVTFNSNTISTNNSLDLNLTAAGGDIFTQNTNLDLGTGVLTVNSVQHAHVPTGAIIIWYGNSGNVPTGWVICDGNNGTPNLSGRFIVCSGTSETTYSAGQSGGQDQYAFSIQEMPAHNHSGNTVDTTQEHTHPIVLETATSEITHGHELNNHTSTENATQSHTHTYVATTSGSHQGEHSHSGTALDDPGGLAPHAHALTSGTESEQTDGSHEHNIDIQFSYSGQSGLWVGGTLPPVGQCSIQLDDNIDGSAGMDQLSQGVADVRSATSAHSHGPTQTENAQHSHTVQISGMNTPSAHTHVVPGGTTAVESGHVHGLTLSLDQHTSSHKHAINTNTGEQSASHNHAIPSEGGSTVHDNRPKWYSLFYIMKT
tara:strand:- start:1468 stop:3624 length:2157 start_codon:yes stop_codon:yes gene_type:complete